MHAHCVQRHSTHSNALGDAHTCMDCHASSLDLRHICAGTCRHLNAIAARWMQSDSITDCHALSGADQSTHPAPDTGSNVSRFDCSPELRPNSATDSRTELGDSIWRFFRIGSTNAATVLRQDPCRAV